MTKWYLYLDDERQFDAAKCKEYNLSCHIHGQSIPCCVRDYKSMIDLLKEFRANNDQVILDLDHDLGTKKSGYDVCKWIVENEYPIIAFHIHSMNAVGVLNMKQLMKRYGYEQF